MQYAWDWSIFLQPAPDGSGSYLHMMLDGARLTIALASSAWMLALLFGIPLGIIRFVGGWPGGIARAYVEVFRNIPLLVQMFLWYFVLPEFLPDSLKLLAKQSSGAPLVFGILGLGFYTSARIAEQVRAGLSAIPAGQTAAARAVGLTEVQVFRYVLLPRAGRMLMPVLTSESISIVKNSAVALTIGVLELTSRARSMQEYSFQVFEAFIFATAGYLIINVLVLAAMALIQRLTSVPGLTPLQRSKGS